MSTKKKGGKKNKNPRKFSQLGRGRKGRKRKKKKKKGGGGFFLIKFPGERGGFVGEAGRPTEFSTEKELTGGKNPEGVNLREKKRKKKKSEDA